MRDRIWSLDEIQLAFPMDKQLLRWEKRMDVTQYMVLGLRKETRS